MISKRENLLRVIHFNKPEYIPTRFSISSACWNYYPQEALQELMESHQFLFPGFKSSSKKVEPKYAPWRRAGEPYVDSWGCIWETKENGITGAVKKHPLEDWKYFESYVPPDPNTDSGWGSINWEQIAKNIQNAKKSGRIARGSLRHGHTFLTLTYIRGYENLLFDMVDEEPRLYELIQMVEDFNMAIVRRYIDLGVEWMGYPEDLGMQIGPMLSPKHFRKYIKPSYKRLMKPAKDAECILHMHSDGDIRELVSELLDCGIDIINLQDLVNGVDWIKENLVGRVCIDLDIDRQRIVRFGTPAQVDALIREEVEKLGSKEGGLIMSHGLYPGVPIENIKALMDAMEKYATYYQ